MPFGGWWVYIVVVGSRCLSQAVPCCSPCLGDGLVSKVLPTHVWGLRTVSLHKKLDLMTPPVILSAIEVGTAWSLEVVTLASSWVLCLGRDYISKRKKNKIKWKCDQGGHASSNYGPKTRKNKISAGLGAWEQAGSVALFSRLSNHPNDLNSLSGWPPTFWAGVSTPTVSVTARRGRWQPQCQLYLRELAKLNVALWCQSQAPNSHRTPVPVSSMLWTYDIHQQILGPHWLWLKMYH